MVDESADKAQPFAEWGAPGLEGSVKDWLRDSRWSKFRWHAFRWGGCAVCYHHGPHLRFLMWWGRWRRLQTTLEYATRYSDPEVVGPLLLPMADNGGFVGAVVEVPVMDLWPAAMYAKETVAIKGLVKELGTLPAADKCALGRATEGGGNEPSDSNSSTSSSESSGSSLESAGSDVAAKKSDVAKRAVGTLSGKRAMGTFVVGVKSTAGRQPRGGGGKRKRGPVGAPAPKPTGRAASGTAAPKRWRLPAVGGAVRVHGLVPGGPKVVLGGDSVGGRPAARPSSSMWHRRACGLRSSSPEGASAGGVQTLSPGGRVGRRRGQCRGRGVEVQAARRGPTQPCDPVTVLLSTGLGGGRG